MFNIFDITLGFLSINVYPSSLGNFLFIYYLFFLSFIGFSFPPFPVALRLLYVGIHLLDDLYQPLAFLSFILFFLFPDVEFKWPVSQSCWL